MWPMGQKSPMPHPDTPQACRYEFYLADGPVTGDPIDTGDACVNRINPMVFHFFLLTLAGFLSFSGVVFAGGSPPTSGFGAMGFWPLRILMTASLLLDKYMESSSS